MKALFIFVLLAVAASVCDAQWVQTNCPIPGAWSITFDKFLYVSSVVTGGHGILLRSNDNGNSWDTLGIWIRPPSQWRGYNAWYLLISFDTVLVAAVVEKQDIEEDLSIVRSTDGGHTWIDTTRIGSRVNQFLRMNSRLYAFMDGIEIFSSTNCAVTWDTVWHSGLPNDYLGAVVSKAPLVFCGTFNHGVFRSTSFGQSWVPASSGLSSGIAGGLEYVGDTLFCLIADIYSNVSSVFRSTNDGTTWSNASSGLSGGTGNPSFWSFRGFLFTATSTGLFASTNRGDSWHLWDEGLPHNPPNNPTNFMTFSDTFAFALAEGGVWRRPLSEMITDVKSDQRLPTQFVLDQNYPNPFNPSTTINYQLPTINDVVLKVYDVLGCEVATLVNAVKQPGTHTVQFDGGGLASGVYFYQLHAGTFVNTKKFLLLR